MGLIWSLDCKQLRPETPILNNWDLIQFLQFPRISPIPTEGKQNQCCWILNCALRKKLVFNDPIFQYICISQTSCNGSRSFSLSTFTKHKKVFIKIQDSTNPPFLDAWKLRPYLSNVECKNHLVRALLCQLLAHHHIAYHWIADQLKLH